VFATRPPEVFAGVQRKGTLDLPLFYPKGANIPQVWSTGSIFHMLRVISTCEITRYCMLDQEPSISLFANLSSSNPWSPRKAISQVEIN
jgi:glycogen debranching enzyme